MLWLFVLLLVVLEARWLFRLLASVMPRLDRTVEVLFVVGCVLISGPLIFHFRSNWRQLKVLVGRLWRFYRHGDVGAEPTLETTITGDSLSRLRATKRDFLLESHFTSFLPRPTVVHCPMCRTILLGYPTDRVECPKCGEGITYLQLAIDYDSAARSEEWSPRHVGEFLKRRYGAVWR